MSDRTCSLPDCVKAVHHNYPVCPMHLFRMRRNGSYDGVIFGPRS